MLIENTVNYIETNLSDDPGRKKIIIKRGCTYPERVMNSSRSLTSIMMAANAVGELFPVYIMCTKYRLKMDLKKIKYNRSKTDWFDAICFKDWLKKVTISFLKNKNEIKVSLRNNLP